MSVQMLLKIAVCVIVPYLLGSVSVGILVGKRNGHDIRNEGSRNTGASNVLRSVGIRAAAVTFLGDFLKAALAVLLGQALLSRDGGMLAGLFVIIGHNWPVFFSFRGGKGIACSAAVLLMTFFWQGAAAAILCLIVIWLTRYISVGSLTLVSVFTVLLYDFVRGFLFDEDAMQVTYWGLCCELVPEYLEEAWQGWKAIDLEGNRKEFDRIIGSHFR